MLAKFLPWFSLPGLSCVEEAEAEAEAEVEVEVEVEVDAEVYAEACGAVDSRGAAD